MALFSFLTKSPFFKIVEKLVLFYVSLALYMSSGRFVGIGKVSLDVRYTIFFAVDEQKMKTRL